MIFFLKIFDKDSNILFKYRDVLKALGYSDIDHTIVDMKINSENKKNYTTILALGNTPELKDNLNIHKRVRII